MSLFRANIEPRCAYCRHGVPLFGKDTIGCTRRGVMDAADHCRKFHYDPFKRVPPKPVRLKDGFSDADFQYQ